MPPERIYIVYILVSENNTARHYTGITTDLEERLSMHNRGAVPSTAKDGPWRVETSIRFRSEEKARAFEKYLKSDSGREFARRHF
jgi:predicted GIY-YIG superfamily endonuclease